MNENEKILSEYESLRAKFIDLDLENKQSKRIMADQKQQIIKANQEVQQITEERDELQREIDYLNAI